MRVEGQSSYVLHGRSYRETSLLLEIFSLDYGRLTLIAKGIKGPGKKSGNILQPYQKLKLSWQGKSELKTCTRAEPDGPAVNLSSNALIAAFYLNELIIKLLHKHEAHSELFNAYHEAIKGLEDRSIDLQVILRIFEKKLLGCLGYGLILNHDIDSSPIDTQLYYYYLANSGPQLKKPSSGDYVQLSGQTLVDMDNETLKNPASLREAKTLMRYLISKQMDHQPLASKALYKAYLKEF